MKKIILGIFLFSAGALNGMESSLSTNHQKAQQPPLKGLGDPTLRSLENLMRLKGDETVNKIDPNLTHKNPYIATAYLPIARFIFSEMELTGGNFAISQGPTGLFSSAIYLGKVNGEVKMVIKLLNDNAESRYRNELKKLQGLAQNETLEKMNEKFSQDPKYLQLTYPLAFYTYGKNIFVVLKGASGGENWIWDAEPSLRWLGRAMAHFAIEFSEPWLSGKKIDFENCIVYGDLTQRNMKFSSDGKVYLIDNESMYGTLPGADSEKPPELEEAEEGIWKMYNPKLNLKYDLRKIFDAGQVISGANYPKNIPHYSKIFAEEFGKGLLEIIEELPEEEQKKISFEGKLYDVYQDLIKDVQKKLEEMILDYLPKPKNYEFNMNEDQD